MKNFNPSTTIDEGKPQAVALELSMEEVTEEEEVLRVEKEKELKRRKEE